MTLLDIGAAEEMAHEANIFLYICQSENQLPSIYKKGDIDQNIQKNIDKIVAATIRKVIFIGNLGWVEPLC